MKIVIAIGGTVSLAMGIIDYTCFVSYYIYTYLKFKVLHIYKSIVPLK